MDTEDSNGCDGYESCMNTNASTTADGSSLNYTFTFALDCKHLMACGKCDLNDEECPIHKKKPTYPRYPRYPTYPYYPYYDPWWQPPYYYWTTTPTESNKYW